MGISNPIIVYVFAYDLHCSKLLLVWIITLCMCMCGIEEAFSQVKCPPSDLGVWFAYSQANSRILDYFASHRKIYPHFLKPWPRPIYMYIF